MLNFSIRYTDLKVYLSAMLTAFQNYFHTNAFKTKLFCVLGFGVAYVVFRNIHAKNYYLYFHNLKKLVFKKSYDICIVSSLDESGTAIEQLYRKCQDKRVLGMDCEWVSTVKRRHPVALLQLATSDGFCSLFRLSSINNIPRELMVLLEDKTLLKVGVAVMSDARFLLADYGVRCEGCLDLRYLAAKANVEPRGLANLAKQLLGVELDKDWRVRCSDWEADVLTPKQIQYAAQDACVAVDIFHKLNDKEMCKKYSLWRRLCWSNREYWNNSRQVWAQYVGSNFKQNLNAGINQASRVQKTKSTHDAPIKRNYNTLLQRNHYDNIILQAPDSQVLCTIGVSRASWYVQNNLVDVICEDPQVLRLKFEPKNRTNNPDGYYTKPKENRCVVCGFGNDLRRKNVVPAEYRKHFKDSLKKHHSHDVLLLCLACHTRSNMYDQTLREHLSVQCEAPFGDKENNKLRYNPELKTLRSAARALYQNGSKFVLPKHRKSELETVIVNTLGISYDHLTKDFLMNIANIECFEESAEYVAHGQKVVQYYEQPEAGGVECLEKRWRRHFVDSMSPRFLPELWSVNYVRD